MIKNNNDKVSWAPLRRHGVGENNFRRARPNSFYPIYVNKDTKIIEAFGDPLDSNLNIDTCPSRDGCFTVLPVRDNGEEMVWGVTNTKAAELYSKGYFKIGEYQPNHKQLFKVYYLPSGITKSIEDGEITVIGRESDNSVILQAKDMILHQASNQWDKPEHDASQHGTKLIQNLIGTRFSYPKSLYAVKDCINYCSCVANNPNSVILDFFAGSGTTLHAVNLLNAEDGGQRKCILVTNNEVGESFEKDFISANKNNQNCVKITLDNKGKENLEIIRDSNEFKSFSDKYGIATYVTWPRTLCSINGMNINGEKLDGNYIGSNLPMEDGFNSNVKMFYCDWISRQPEDYLLSNALCLHVKELIELQTAKEIDGVKNVILYGKSDYKKIFENPEKIKKVENVWINENILFNAAEIKKIKLKNFKYIPREFFSQELKEVGEYV